MALPYSLWPQVSMSNQAYAIPQLLPSSSALVVNPTEAIRDYAEHVISGDRRAMCSEQDKKNLEEWAKNDEYRKAIMTVLKARLDMPWPYNYKAMDILACMPVGEMADCLDKVTKLNESAVGVEGAQHLKIMAKGIVEKGKKEKERVEGEEAAKRMAAVAGMWGGLWSNQPTTAQVATQGAGWAGWPYPYRQLPPGIAMQGQTEWQSTAPEGWTPWVVTPVPMGSASFPILGFPRQYGPYGWNPTHYTPFSYLPFRLPPNFGPPVDPAPRPQPQYVYLPTAVPQIYPFSRTGYYALIPSEPKPPTNDKAKIWVNVGTTPRHDATATKGLPIDLGAIWKAAEKKGDGWFNMAAGSA